MYDTEPELIGIYNNGVKGGGGGGGSGSGGVSINIPEATLTTPGAVTTCNASASSATSETVSLVPTQYYVQTEIARLESSIASGAVVGESSGGASTPAVQEWISYEDMGSSATVTVSAGHAYNLEAFTGSHTVSAVTSTGKVGQNAYMTIAYTDAATVTFAPNIVMNDMLATKKANDCVFRFRGDTVYASVEGTHYAYAVTVTSGTGSGTISYGLYTLNMDAIGFATSINDSACDLGGMQFTSAALLDGNGIDRTLLSGGMVISSGLSLANLTLQDATVSSGRLTMLGAGLGGTVVNSGTIAFEGSDNVCNGTVSCGTAGHLEIASGGSVTGSGTFNLGTTGALQLTSGTSCYVGGVTFTNGSASNGGVVAAISGARATFEDCTFSGNHGSFGLVANLYSATAVFSNCQLLSNSGSRGLLQLGKAGSAVLTSCTISGNATNGGGSLVNIDGGFISITDCNIVGEQTIQGANGDPSTVVWAGSNAFGGITKLYAKIKMQISAGATLDFTGNPGDTSGCILYGSWGVTVGSYTGTTWNTGGSATVITSDGSAVTISGSGTKLDKSGVLS